MEQSSLFNSGFLGAHFNWWVGQIVDDSTWRDNISSNKFEGSSQIPGQSRRYKVRIIGLHDQDTASIADDQLPWAQVMYPVTAGGGQAGVTATAALRQGNFVFGFFLDGADQQVPLIMGVLGNNAQTTLNTKIGSKGFVPTSGHAQGANPDPNLKVPDDRIAINKPKSAAQGAEALLPKTNVALNQYGLPANSNPTPEQAADIASATAAANQNGLTGSARDAFIRQVVTQGIQNRTAQAESAATTSQPGATIEHIDNPHQQSVADVKRQELYEEKIIIMNPCDMVGSALKAIQALLEKLTNKINKYLNKALSYIDAATNIINQIRAFIDDIACQIAKYLKIIFDKIMAYIMKMINKAMAPTVQSMPPNKRNLFLTIKEKIIELIHCLFNQITNGLCGQVGDFLNKNLNTKNLPSTISQAQRASSRTGAGGTGGTGTGGTGTGAGGTGTGGTGGTGTGAGAVTEEVYTQVTNICSVENLTGAIIYTNMPKIDDATDKILNIVNGFLADMASDLAAAGVASGYSDTLGNLSGTASGYSDTLGNVSRNVSGNVSGTASGYLNAAGNALDTASGYLNAAGSAITNVNTAINGITGSIMSALSFTNIKLNVFGCDLSPKCAVSDHYTLHEGGGGAEQPQLPRLAEVDANSRSNDPVKSTTEIAFATPLLIDKKVNYNDNNSRQSLEKISQPRQ